MRIPTFLLAAAGAFSIATAVPAQRFPARSDTVPVFAGETDSVAALLGLPTLRAADELRRPGREIRIWVGFGLTLPDRLLRVAETPDGVTGQETLWWPGDGPEGGVAGSGREVEKGKLQQRDVSRRLEHGLVAVGCTRVRRSLSYAACDVGRRTPTDWRGVLARIDSLGAWTLPDESAVPGLGPIGRDGITVMVEVRDGGRYRTYAYWCPQLHPEIPEAARAAQLIELDAMPAR